MKRKIAALALIGVFMFSSAAAIDLGSLWKDNLDQEFQKINQSTAERLDFSASDTSISKLQGFIGYFSIVTGSDSPSPGEDVTFETTVDINNMDTVCDDYISPDGIQLDIWLEGESVSKSGTKDTLYISCFGDGVSDASIDFSLPHAEGEFSYDFKVGSEYTDSFGNSFSWEETVETDSVVIEVKDLVADIDTSDTEVVEGESITFDGSDSDGFAGIDYYEWYIDGELLDDNDVFTYNFDSPGEREVKLRVSDFTWRGDSLDERRWESTTVDVNVLEDSDGDGIADVNDDCPDTEGEEEYDGCNDPDPDGDGVEEDNDDCPETPGVESLDGCPNTEPEIKRVSTDPSTVFEGDEVTFSISATDIDGQSLDYTTSYNGEEKTGSNPSFTFKSSGTKTVNIEVTDGVETVEKTVDVQVEESALNETGSEDETSDRDNTGESTETEDKTLSSVEKAFYGFITWLTSL